MSEIKLRVICVLRSGGEYFPTHVHNLMKMCEEHLPAHNFMCLTDTPEKLNCNTVRLRGEHAGWWAKLEMFDHFTDGENLFMDLDTVLRGSCELLLAGARGKPFVILRDFYRPHGAMQSSVMYWSTSHQWIYQKWAESGFSTSGIAGDQNFIEQVFRDTPGRDVFYWQDISNQVCSYKVHIRGCQIPSSAPLVCFHGKPRPWLQNDVNYFFDAGSKPKLALRRGWVVPSHDTHLLGASLREVKEIDRMVSHCTQRRNAFQSGGNIGIWASAIASRFKHCYTAEPEPENFACLEINTRDTQNITRYQTAVGESFGETNLQITDGNAGAHYCVGGSGILITPIDALGLSDIDFVQLDVEGFEHHAILGAEKTIKASWPVVVLELKGLGNKYGYPDSSTVDLLQTWGYRIVDRIARDVVFKKL